MLAKVHQTLRSSVGEPLRRRPQHRHPLCRSPGRARRDALAFAPKARPVSGRISKQGRAKRIDIGFWFCENLWIWILWEGDIWKRIPVDEEVGPENLRAGSAEFSRPQAEPLVERFDIEPFSDFTTKWSNFRGLVLGCIDSYDSNQIVILQGFSRSTRFAILCTAQISKFEQKFIKLFSKFRLNFCKIASFQHFFIEFCTDSDENFSEFR